MNAEPKTYQSAADCPLGSAHGMASTHGNADDETCCDFCGFPVDNDDDCPIVADRLDEGRELAAMNADILNDLAARVEAGSADMQRELLNESWNALAQHSADFRTFARARCPGFWANASKFAVMLDAWAFESAAMTLVPEGLRFEVTTTGYRPGATVCGNILTGVHEGSYAATPALALTAAALRAHAAIAKENEGG